MPENNNFNILKSRNPNNSTKVRNNGNIAPKLPNPKFGVPGLVLGKIGNIPGSKIIRKVSKNEINEDGLIQRIASAKKKKNYLANLRKNNTSSQNNSNNNLNAKKDNTNPMQNNNSNNNETNNQESEGGVAALAKTFKDIKKWSSIVAPFMGMISLILMFAAPQVIGNSVGFAQADETSSADADKKINEMGSEDFNKELGFNIDTSSEKTFKKVKILNEQNFISNEQSYLTQLKDYYSNIGNSSNLNYDMNTVYKFFYKLYFIQRYYLTNYGVEIDMPLLMSILSVQSADKSVVFSSNIINYNLSMFINNINFNYYKDWSDYQLSSSNSEHDIEVLVQNMVSVRTNINQKPCKNEVKDGKCYELVSEKEYQEFLNEFLEKKYYVGGSIEKTVKIETETENQSTGYCLTSFPKYNLSEDQLIQIASQAAAEQGTPKGAAAEASLMANLFEIKGSKFGEGADGLYNYVRNSGWFANSKETMDKRNASEEIISAVRSVLVNGKRTLPAYIDEHDCIVCYDDGSGDILSASNAGNNISVTDKESYIKHTTILKNRYGGTYTFFTFPTSISDPFGYTSETLRQEKGEFYFDFDTGEPQNCSTAGNIVSFEEFYSDGKAVMEPGITLDSEPDPSVAINYWDNLDTNNFIYPKDKATGLSLGAWPKNYQTIPFQLTNVKTYQGAYIWPLTPENGIYAFVYEHNGMDIMAEFGSPIYSPVDGELVYSTWGYTTNLGSDETAYSVTITPHEKISYGGIVIDEIFFTHMAGIVYRCDWGQCNRNVKKGELLGFSGNAAGNSSSIGWAPHLHLSYYNSSDYDTGLSTSIIENLYGITSNTSIKAGE